VRSTSAGRLFDAVSAILGIRLFSSYEGEASMMLEFAAEKYKKTNTGNENWTDLKLTIIPRYDNNRWYLKTDALVKYMIKEKLSGKSPEELAYEFHVILSEQIVDTCKAISSESGIHVCALSGGVFQNRLLLTLCDQKLSRAGFRVLKHSLIPPNDGGIALGQAVIAMAKINQDK
jgi:hydrogenase maturation protein HypF